MCACVCVFVCARMCGVGVYLYGPVEIREQLKVVNQVSASSWVLGTELGLSDLVARTPTCLGHLTGLLGFVLWVCWFICLFVTGSGYVSQLA